GRYPWEMSAVWEGGRASHGGLILGPVVGAWLAYRWRLPVLRGLDVAAPSIALGQAIGRWGNFFNEEAFGQPTDLLWKLYISPPHRPLGFGQYEYFHPTSLYESLWDLMLFGLLSGVPRARLAGRPVARAAGQRCHPPRDRQGRARDAGHPPGLRVARRRRRGDRCRARRDQPRRDRVRHQLRRTALEDPARRRRRRDPDGAAGGRALRCDPDGRRLPGRVDARRADAR